MMHNTGRKGDIGVAAVVADILERGLEILLPLSSMAPYDLVVIDKDKFWKIQVKYVTESRNRLCVQVKRHVISNTKHVSRKLLSDEADVLAIYCPQRKAVYYVSMKSVGISKSIRFDYPKTGQRKGINIADKLTVFPPDAGW